MTVVAAHNTSRKQNGKTEKQRLAEAEAILSDHINGMPMSQVMEKYGVGRATAYRRINDAVAARIAPTVDAYREQMNAAYDEQVERCGQHLAAAQAMIQQGTTDANMDLLERGMTHHLKAMEMLGRTREAQRKLNGLDAPVTANVNVTLTTPLDASIESLVSQLDAPASA